MLPSGWQPGNSDAIEAFRYLDGEGVLQIAFVSGRLVYDYPCPSGMYEQFVAAHSRGKFVNHVLKPYARQRGWSRPAYPWPW